MSGVSIGARDLACVRGERLVFSGLTFSVTAGEVVEIVGPNGSGKSSLLRIAAGLLSAASGQLEIKDSDAPDREQASLVHLVSHLEGLKSVMSPLETATFYAGLLGGRGNAAEALNQVGLDRQKDLPVQFLSAGQRRRLALARLLVAQRPVWLLDEPLASLDINGKAVVATLIGRHLSAGGVVLAATHETIIAGARRVALGASA